jgi:hypothetical protein
MTRSRFGLLFLVLALLVPHRAFAQVTGSIAGTVRDVTGAVLPGATVEAASPALIEKVRAAVTDAQGNYKIVDLRPGTYTVTVTLGGFSTYKREGLELSAGFTANVSAELKVGSLEETVTVTGATPIVDVQSARTQNVMRAETLNQLPSGAKNLMAFAAMTLGAMPSSGGRNDVGGDKGEQATGIVLHGGRGDDGRVNWDGMSTNVFFGNAGGQQRTYYFNTVAIQETVIDTGGANAETETGGANINMVPREGGNSLKVYGSAAYTNQDLSAKAVPDDIKARGTTDQSSLKHIYDYGVAVGGPLKQDKAWFYGTSRWWGADNFGAGNYFNKSTNPYKYEADKSRPAYASMFFVDSSFRMTWQVNDKHKINHEFHLQHGCSCWLGIGNGQQASPEAVLDFNYGPQILNQTTWSYPATNKLLFQAGATFLRQEVNFVNDVSPNASKFTGIGSPTLPKANQFSIYELATGYNYGGLGLYRGIWGNDDKSNNYNQKFTVQYITGSHAFKTGVQAIRGVYDIFGFQNGPMENYFFLGGSPLLIQQWAGPFATYGRLHGEGFFAQDQWTVKRLTINAGARYDQFYARSLAKNNPAGKYIPARAVPAADGIPDFKDITARAGVAYDVFGNGKTAIKASWGKYLMGQGGQLIEGGFAPSLAIVQSVTRLWLDFNGNFTPDCNLTASHYSAPFGTNGECGPISNAAFGQPFSNVTLADDARKGWGHREFNYQTSIQLQQELRPGLGLAVGYFNTRWGNMSVTRDTAVSASDFTSYCITAPTDTKLGNFSGDRICGYYDVNPAKFGQVQKVVTLAKNFGTPKDYFHGVDIGINARWGKGALLTGGVSVGRQTFDVCYANNRPDLTPQNSPGAPGFGQSVNYPRNADYCRIQPSWWNGGGSQVKLQMVYPLPAGVMVSGTYKHLPGIPINGNVVLPGTATTLGRDFSAGPGSTQTHAVIPVGSGNGNGGGATATMFDMRLNQTDVRLTKAIKVGRAKIDGNFDIYNLFNSRVPQGNVSVYGPTFLQPSSLLGGRLFKFGAQVDW